MPARTALAVRAACLVAALTAPAASAVTCFVVMDRSDNVIYRDVLPPVDLSEAGVPAREAMRRRGEFFLFHEVETCPRIEFFTGGAGSVGLSLDQTLAPSPPPPKPAAASASPAPRR